MKSRRGRRVPIIGVDPGPEQSGLVSVFPRERCTDSDSRFDLIVIDKMTVGNSIVREYLLNCLESDFMDDAIVSIEGLQPYETGSWQVLAMALEIGGWRELWERASKRKMIYYTRPEIISHMTGGRNYKQAAVRGEVCRRFGASSVSGAKGSAKNPGPLYGVSGHAWEALSVALVAWEDFLRNDSLINDQEQIEMFR